MVSFLEEQTGAITEYSEVLVRRLIEKIRVFDEKMTVKFKSGLEIDVEHKQQIRFAPAGSSSDSRVEIFIIIIYNKLYDFYNLQ